jgi:hypothetical protein
MELKLLLDNNEIDKTFCDICFKIIDILDKEFEFKTYPLIQKLDKNELIKNSDSCNFFNIFEQSVQFDVIFKKLRNEKFEKHSKIKSDLEHCLNLIMNNLYKKSVDCELDSIKIDLLNLKFLSTFSGKNCNDDVLKNSLENLYQQAKDYIFKHIKEYVDNDSKNIIQEQDLNSICKELNKINRYKSVFAKEHNLNLDEIYDNVQDRLTKTFENKIENSCGLLKRFKESTLSREQNEEIFEKINQADEFFNLAKNYKSLQEHLPDNSLNNNYNKFLSNIQNHFEATKDLTIIEIKSENSNYNFIEMTFHQLSLFKKNINFSMNCINIYYEDLMQILVEKIEECKLQSVNLINKLTKSPKEFNNFFKYCDTLIGLRWLDNYKNNFVSNHFRHINDQISENLENLEEQLEGKKLVIGQFGDLETINNVTSKIFKLEKLFCKSYPFSEDIKSRIMTKKNWLNEKVTYMN